MPRNHSLHGRPSSQTRSEAKRYLVVTNGQRTETQYFNIINQLTTDYIKTRFKNCDISDLIALGAETKATGDFDGCFIVIDVDERINTPTTKQELIRAIQRAKSCDVEIILSHESFEVWLLCHVIKVPAGTSSRRHAQSLAERERLLCGKNNKQISLGFINKESIRQACREAGRLRRVYGADTLNNGPTTDVDKIIFRLNDLMV